MRADTYWLLEQRAESQMAVGERDNVICWNLAGTGVIPYHNDRWSVHLAEADFCLMTRDFCNLDSLQMFFAECGTDDFM